MQSFHNNNEATHSSHPKLVELVYGSSGKSLLRLLIPHSAPHHAMQASPATGGASEYVYFNFTA
jgi:hypothetical protein